MRYGPRMGSAAPLTSETAMSAAAVGNMVHTDVEVKHILACQVSDDDDDVCDEDDPNDEVVGAKYQSLLPTAY